MKRKGIVAISNSVTLIAVILIFFLTGKSDSMRYTHFDAVVGQRADFSVRLGYSVKNADIIAEQWQNGKCTSSAPVTINDQTRTVSILFTDRDENGETVGENIQIDTDETAGSLITYFELPDNVTGHLFSTWGDGTKIKLHPGDEIFLAAFRCDTGNGAMSIDCETITQSYLESADNIIVIRAVMSEEAVSSTAVSST